MARIEYTYFTYKSAFQMHAFKMLFLGNSYLQMPSRHLFCLNSQGQAKLRSSSLMYLIKMQCFVKKKKMIHHVLTKTYSMLHKSNL